LAIFPTRQSLQRAIALSIDLPCEKVLATQIDNIEHIESMTQNAVDVMKVYAFRHENRYDVARDEPWLKVSMR